jgi:hypothetical protein
VAGARVSSLSGDDEVYVERLALSSVPPRKFRGRTNRRRTDGTAAPADALRTNLASVISFFQTISV